MKIYGQSHDVQGFHAKANPVFWTCHQVAVCLPHRACKAGVNQVGIQLKPTPILFREFTESDVNDQSLDLK